MTTPELGEETKQIIAWLKAQSVHPYGAPPWTVICAHIAHELEQGRHLRPDQSDIAAAEFMAERSTKQ